MSNWFKEWFGTGEEDTVVAVAAVIILVAFMSGALINRHWEHKVRQAPLACRVILLDDHAPWEGDPEQPTSPGSGR